MAYGSAPKMTISTRSLVLASLTTFFFIFFVGPVTIPVMLHTSDIDVFELYCAVAGILMPLGYVWIMYFKYRFPNLETMEAHCSFPPWVYMIVFVATPTLVLFGIFDETSEFSSLKGAWALPVFAFISNFFFYPFLKFWSQRLSKPSHPTTT